MTLIKNEEATQTWKFLEILCVYSKGGRESVKEVYLKTE